MSSLRPQDRISLCQFTFSDGRRCRSPRARSSPDFCHYHALKDARDRTAAQLGDDFDALLSGHYISAGDLSAVLARLCAAVARGHIKPRAARTLAFLAQTLLQSIRLSQHEFISAFGNNAWRQAVAGNVNHNIRYFRDLAASPSATTAPRQRTQPQPAEPASPQPDSSPAASSDLPTSTPHSVPTSKLPRSASAFAAAVLRAHHACEPPATAPATHANPPRSHAAPNS